MTGHGWTFGAGTDPMTVVSAASRKLGDLACPKLRGPRGLHPTPASCSLGASTSAERLSNCVTMRRWELQPRTAVNLRGSLDGLSYGVRIPVPIRHQVWWDT